MAPPRASQAVHSRETSDNTDISYNTALSSEIYTRAPPPPPSPETSTTGSLEPLSHPYSSRDGRRRTLPDNQNRQPAGPSVPPNRRTQSRGGRFFIADSVASSPLIPTGSGSSDTHSHSHLSASSSAAHSLAASYNSRETGASLSTPRSPIFAHSQSVAIPRNRSSRASLAALTSALQLYRIPSPDESSDFPSPSPPLDPTTPEAQIRRLHPSIMYPASAAVSRTATSLPGSGTGFRPLTGLPLEIMDALVDIHRVLYRGAEDLRVEGKTSRKWREQTGEVRRVVDRWCEGDCVYDHPAIRLSSRDSVFAHFILLHLISAGYAPSLTPTAVFLHARRILATARNFLPFTSSARSVDADAEAESGLYRDIKGKGRGTSKLGPSATLTALDKGKMRARNERLARIGLGPSAAPVKKTKSFSSAIAEWYGFVSSAPTDADVAWWKLWEVNADCKEIGGMECYDGFHLALIEHVVTLTLLPAFRHSKSSNLHSSSCSSLDLVGTKAGAQAKETDCAGLALPLPVPSHTASTPPPGFVTKLVGALAREFEYLLRWELPMSTFVEFNEVGKATSIRDVVDVKDLIETFVPFAKRLGWITRSVTGLASSIIGHVVVSVVPPTSPPMKSTDKVAGTKSRATSRKEPVPSSGLVQRVPPVPEITTSNVDTDPLFGPGSRNLDAVEAGVLEQVGFESDAEMGFGAGGLSSIGATTPPARVSRLASAFSLRPRAHARFDAQWDSEEEEGEEEGEEGEEDENEGGEDRGRREGSVHSSGSGWGAGTSTAASTPGFTLPFPSDIPTLGRYLARSDDSIAWNASDGSYFDVTESVHEDESLQSREGGDGLFRCPRRVTNLQGEEERSTRDDGFASDEG